MLWTPGRGRPVCPLIRRKPGGAFVASQLSHCKRFANPKSGRRDAEQGQLSQTGSPVESSIHTSRAPVAGSALEDVSALWGILWGLSWLLQAPSAIFQLNVRLCRSLDMPYIFLCADGVKPCQALPGVELSADLANTRRVNFPGINEG